MSCWNKATYVLVISCLESHYGTSVSSLRARTTSDSIEPNPLPYTHARQHTHTHTHTHSSAPSLSSLRCRGSHFQRLQLRLRLYIPIDKQVPDLSRVSRLISSPFATHLTTPMGWDVWENVKAFHVIAFQLNAIHVIHKGRDVFSSCRKPPQEPLQNCDLSLVTA